MDGDGEIKYAAVNEHSILDLGSVPFPTGRKWAECELGECGLRYLPRMQMILVEREVVTLSLFSHF